MITLTRTVSVRAMMLEQAYQTSLPMWVRIGCLAWACANNHGHAPFSRGELRSWFDLRPATLSQSLTTARRLKWIDPTSTARCLVLPGCGLNPCEETHR